MKRFMIRVELHNARLAAQYEQLHTLLAQYGIVNEIVSDKGQRYRLPPAEYYYQGYHTHEQLLATAKQCAGVVDVANSVVVTESTVIAWDGLKLVA
jgi:hypothetical protein